MHFIALTISALISLPAAAGAYDTPIARAVYVRMHTLDLDTVTPSRDRRARTYLRQEYGILTSTSGSPWASLHPDQREELAVREAIEDELNNLIGALGATGDARAHLTQAARDQLGELVDTLLAGVADPLEARRLRLAATGTFEWAMDFRPVPSREDALVYASYLADALVRSLERVESLHQQPRSPGVTRDITAVTRTAARLIAEAYLISAFTEPAVGWRANPGALIKRILGRRPPLTVASHFWDQVRAQQLSNLPIYADSNFEMDDGDAQVAADVMAHLRDRVEPAAFAAACEELFR